MGSRFLMIWSLSKDSDNSKHVFPCVCMFVFVCACAWDNNMVYRNCLAKSSIYSHPSPCTCYFGLSWPDGPQQLRVGGWLHFEPWQAHHTEIEHTCIMGSDQLIVMCYHISFNSWNYYPAHPVLTDTKDLHGLVVSITLIILTTAF